MRLWESPGPAWPCLQDLHTCLGMNDQLSVLGNGFVARQAARLV
jgi:hypothetical protein